MSCRKICVGLVVAAGCAFVTGYAVSQEESSLTSKEAEQAKLMEEFANFSAPGDEHKKLEQFIGNWKTTYKFWQSPDSEPMETTGTAKFNWILGGRFIEGNYTGSFMDLPFEGRFCVGYNKINEEYQANWMCTMCTSITSFTASVDSTGKIFTFFGTYDDIMTGKKDQEMQSVITFVSKDKITEEVYTPGPDGKQTKSSEGTYTRIK